MTALSPITDVPPPLKASASVGAFMVERFLL